MPRREPDGLTLDQLCVGDEWVSPSRTITQCDVVGFAGLSGDFNRIHMDHEFARSTVFKQPIAHGLLGMAIASGLSSNAPRVETLALVAILEWRFHKPIHFGDTIHVRTKIDRIEPHAHGRRGHVTWHRFVLNQNGTLVQEGLSVTLVRGAAGPGAARPSRAKFDE